MDKVDDMRRDSIKYEQLSSDIKKEIESYFIEKSKKNKDIVLAEAMTEWFEKEFDQWMVMNYSGKDDRRQVERRKHPRVEIPVEEEVRGKERRKVPRRKHFRLDIEVPVKIVEMLIESSTEEVEAIEFIGSLINISKGGFYFRFNKPIELSSIIKVIIDLSPIDEELKHIEALAMVVRVDVLPDKNYGLGVMFSSIYDEHKEKLDLFILRNLAYYICTK